MTTPVDAPALIMPVEVQARELLSRILVAVLAVERGYRVILGHDVIIRRLAGYLPRGVLLDKSLGLPRHGKARRFERLGHVVAASDEEGTGYYGSPDHFIGVRLTDETLKHAACWFCISEGMREAVVRRFPEHAHRFVTTGLIRTDLWRPEFQSLYQAETNAIRERIGPFILFCSNFTRVIHGRGRKFFDRQIQRQDQVFEGSWEFTSQTQRQGAANLEKFIEMLPKLSERFPTHKIVIRPHPGEDRAFWHDRFGQHENIEIISEGAATPWILAADCLLHHGCTTGIEAEILGKPHVMYAPVPDTHHDTELMSDFAPVARTEAELIGVMTEILAGQRLPRKNLEDKERWFANLAGKLVADHVLDEIDKHRFPGRPVSGLFPITRLHPRMVIARIKPRSAKAVAYSRQKWSGISLKDMKETVARLSACRGTENRISVRQLLPGLFEITAS